MDFNILAQYKSISEKPKIHYEKIKQYNQSFLSFISRYSNHLLISGTFLYRLLLDYLYIKILSPIYAYSGFIYAPSSIKYFLSWLVTIIIVITLPFLLKQNKNSSLIITLINFIWFIPLQTLYSLKNLSFIFYMSSMLFWLILTILQFGLPFIVFQPLKINSNKIFYTLSLVCIVFVLYIFIKYTGFQILTTITNVYGKRAEAANYQLSTIVSYIYAISRSILPLFTLYFILRKRYIFAFILFCTAYLNYSIDGMKSTFFYLIISLAAYFFYRKEYRWLLSFGLAILSLVSIIEKYLFGSFHLISLFFRRVMFIPIFLSSQYYDYFSAHPLGLLRTGPFGKLGFSSPYTGEIPQMMGWLYQNVATHANNGLIGDAMLCFGLAGMVILPFILVLCFRLLDACSEGIDQRITISICILYSIAFTNTSWSTALLSGGFIVVTFIFFLWPKPKGQLPNKNNQQEI